jgi:phage RecT family recombinase
MTTEPTAIAKQSRSLIPEHIGREIAQVQIQLQELLPKDIQPTQFQAALYIHLSTVRNLEAAESSTIMAAIVKLANYGFLAGEDAYIVVYKDRKTGKYAAQVIPDYRGLIKVLHRSGRVKKVLANPVYERDHFVADELNDVFEHRRELRNRGEILCYYAAVWLNDGTRHVQVMHRDDVEKVRRNAPGAEQDPWQKFPVEMGRKTVLKNLYKYLRFPVDSGFEELMEEEDKLAVLPPSFEQASSASELLFGHPMNDIEGPPAPPTSTAWRPTQRETQPPVLGEARFTGATERQQELIRRLCEQLNWSDPKIDDHIASLASREKASDSIRELQAAVKTRREGQRQASPVHGAPEAFERRLALIGRWKPWADVVPEFLINKKWDWDTLTPTQRVAVAHVVVGVAPLPWVDLFDERWNNIMKWAKETQIEPYELGIWAVDKYASGAVKDSLEYKPKDMPDDAIDAIQIQINQGDSSLADEIRAYAEKMRQL